MEKEDKEKILKAGKITKEVREWSRGWIKKDMLLIEIAEKIESKIIELGGKPAFPTNLSINEIAAHYTPGHDDKTLAHGLLKIDFGVHIDGWTADNAFSLDLENSKENRELIEASEDALKKALEMFKENVELGDLGDVIEKEVEKKGFTPVVNLCGHSMSQYDLHAGITIPNVNNGSDFKLSQGLYAIEPFVTNKNGKVKETNPSGIYQMEEEKSVRNPFTRKALKYIIEEYGTLPFCSRWLVKEFGTKALLALRELERNGNLHQFGHLVETSKGIVAQTEHTVLIDGSKKIITTA